MPSVLQTQFSTEDALAQWTQLMNQAGGGVFSLSPLSSPESTPTSSPQFKDLLLPDPDSNIPLMLGPRSIQAQLTPTPSAMQQSLFGPSLSTPGLTPEHDQSTQMQVNDGAMADSSSSKKFKPPHRRAKQHSAAQAARAKRRIRDKKAAESPLPAPREAPGKKYVDHAATVSTSFQTAKEARVARTGFIGVNNKSKTKKVYLLDEVTGPSSLLNFRLVKWDGRTPMFVSDSEGRALVICAGRPEDNGWDILMDLAADALEVARNTFVPSKTRHNRRGDFASLQCGVSFGGGQTAPSNLSNDKVNEIIADWLNHLEPFQRLAGFTSSVMSTWAKDLHAAYVNNTLEIHKDTTLRKIFPNGVFAAATYNLGPQTVCQSHKDFANLPYGYCAVTSLGLFDPTKGGHLILWELQIVIEFPAGSTILLPSALITHSNTSISPYEKRYSFTQYTAGGLFRWAAHKCKTKAEYLAGLSPEERTQYAQKEGTRWSEGLKLLPIIRAH